MAATGYFIPSPLGYVNPYRPGAEAVSKQIRACVLTVQLRPAATVFGSGRRALDSCSIGLVKGLPWSRELFNRREQVGVTKE
jgi:hypothetical protein